jgi:DNA-binding MarR family transcriptional regulator
MNTIALWSTALEALQALGRHYGPVMDQTAAELKLSEWYGWLLPALVFEPDPISATRFRVRSPYTSARLYNERLAKAAKQGFLTPVAEAENEYRLTELGRQAAERVTGAAYAKMTALQPMPSTELERLASLLHQLVKSCLTTPEPPGKWCIIHSQRTDPGDGASVVVRIDQYLSDLAAYRDDAHLAAWQSHSIEGHVWEAFTYLWRGEATTLEGLYQKLERRGYSQDEYKQALEDLIQRGWVKEEAGEYQVTVLGQEVRQAAEEATDRYFYGAWSCLSQGETEELRTLLILLRDGLQSDS